MEANQRTAVGQAREKGGGAVGLAALLGITSQAVSQWQRIPVEHVLKIEGATGIPRHVLRGDIYPAPVEAAE